MKKETIELFNKLVTSVKNDIEEEKEKIVKKGKEIINDGLEKIKKIKPLD